MRGRSTGLSRMTVSGRGTGFFIVAVASIMISAAPVAEAVDQVLQPTLTSPVPAAFSPAINDGRVLAMAEVDGQIVVGGTFTNASPAGDPGTVLDQAGALSFDETTGELSSSFRPTINGEVNAVAPGPDSDEVYVGGTFTEVDGRSMRIALLNSQTGAVVAGWRPPSLDLGVNKVVLAGNRLFVGGAFTKAGADSHGGLIALNPRTGRLTSYVNLAFTGHHNYGRQCKPSRSTCAQGRPGVRGLAVSPDGRTMVVAGNFTQVAGEHRDQIAMLRLRASHARVIGTWATKAFTARCHADTFDSYIRDVAFAPDGQYFIVAATGGVGKNHDGTYASCDSASRFDTVDRGRNVRPLWIDYSGEDSILTEAVTGTAVYVGGHQRWLNNRYGLDTAGPGAVPRPGIAALDPDNGLPYSWNPGRNPRGAGCYALLATATGLWIGADTDYIGDHAYLRPKVAFFPLDGGEAIPPEPAPSLPGRVFEVGATAPTAADPGRLDYRTFDGSVAGPSMPTSTGVDWSDVRGAFEVGGELFYGKTDGNLYKRSFDGTTLGPEVLVAPYDDPAWRDVQTGSGQTYEGLPSTIAAQTPAISSMFFTDDRLYYTMTGTSTMFWREFEPESGIVGAAEHSVADGHDWSDVAGAFLVGDRLYYADQVSGELMAVQWSTNGALGQPTVVDSSTDWASRALVVLSP